MNARHKEGHSSALGHNREALAGSDRHTLDAIFRYPSSHNLKWKDVAALINAIGDVYEERNNEFVFAVCGTHLSWHRPHTKDFTGSEVLGLRHFLIESGWSDAIPSQAVERPIPAALDLVVVLDRNETKIFQINVASDDASREILRPYDPHHLLHHLLHKDQTRVSDSPEVQSLWLWVEKSWWWDMGQGWAMPRIISPNIWGRIIARHIGVRCMWRSPISRTLRRRRLLK
jgi:hypothetical protein